jgi:CheY-like chemotaxis protein
MSAATILCVDDEAHVLDSLRRVFLDDGHTIITAARGDEALALVRRHAVDLIISDYRMPGMTGAELLRQVHHDHPDLISVVLSGYVKATEVAELDRKSVV